mmetsp:Transcript_120307/g.209482  ORF Transcript_120307/g.209482 Transcript_120307/m.209482 type:complete len:118 (-) Transcript_120307:417-770(-)
MTGLQALPRLGELVGWALLSGPYHSSILTLPCFYLLIATVHCTTDGKPESHGSFFLTCGSVAKCQSYIQHCIGLTMGWVQVAVDRGGAEGSTHVVHSSDHAHREFCNGTNLLHLTRH